MAKINDGGPAFPIADHTIINRIGMDASAGIANVNEQDQAFIAATARAASGMSMRDYFAAKAVQAQLTAFWAMETHHGWSNEEIAREAYAIADAMLKAREA